MKKLIAIALISMALLQANAQTNKGTSATKIDKNGKTPTTTTSNSNDGITKPTGGTTKPTESTVPTNNTGKDEENDKEGKGKPSDKNGNNKGGSSNANEHSKTKSNNGNHYGQIKNADKGKGKSKK
jgi:hypothetical protein